MSPSSVSGLETSRPVAERSAKGEKPLDPKLEQDIDRFMMDDPEIDSTESTLIRRPLMMSLPFPSK